MARLEVLLIGSCSLTSRHTNPLRAHDGDTDARFRLEATVKGFGEYPYCCVMPMADRSLADAVTHENIAGRDWRQIRLIMESCAEFLVQLHERGFIHGDMKVAPV